MSKKHEFIQLLKGLDTNEYYAGPLYLFNDETIYFSNREKRTFYEINQWSSEHPEYRELNLKNKNGSTLIYGYLWRYGNELFVIDWENLYKYNVDGVLLRQLHTQIKINSIRYITDIIAPSFKVVNHKESIIFPVAIRKKAYKRGMKKLFSTANIIVEMTNDGKVIKHFGCYNDKFRSKIFTSLEMNKFYVDSQFVYVLDPLSLVVSQYNLNNMSLINNFQLNYKMKAPEGFAQLNYDFGNQEKIFKQKIESSNSSDIFIWKKNFYLLYSEPIEDTCVVGEVLLRPKKGCYVASIKERNQWVLYYHKPVYLLKFDENGSFLSKQLIELYNDCEVLKVKDNVAYIYSRDSERGGTRIVKVNLE
ncbi:MAG: hypothetical protein H7296_13305 [Bacteroidia bacterium]|nr:hypothetical protein [Bacteroidia bacterium]